MSAASPPFDATVGSSEQRGRTMSRTVMLTLAGLLALLLLTVIHIRQGSAQLSTSTVFDALFFPDGSTQHQVVRFARLPRVAAGITAGAALGIAGVMLQAATRNPLASAATVGVNAGAYLAVVAATVFAPSLVTFSSTLVAFSGGLLAAALVFLLTAGAGSGTTPTRLALAGMATTISLGSITTVLIMFNEYTVAGLYFWGSGSLVQKNWENVAGAWPWVLGIGLMATVTQGRRLDILWLGDDVATSLGQRVRLTRFVTTAIGVLLAAFAVTVAGMIGFVGLVAPHLVRLAGIKRHSLLIPLAALWGGVILVGADVIGRVVAGPMNELPAGIFTAVVGAPWLIWLARRTGGDNAGQGHGSTGMVGFRGANQRLVWSLTLGLLAAMIVTGMAFGDQFKSFATLWDVIRGRADALDTDFVTNQRLPRILVSGMVGAALSVSGLMIQGVVRNPLASPEIVGVAPGAGVGAVAVLIAFPDLSLAWLPLAAAAGGVLAFAVVYAASWANGVSPIRLALVGVGVSAVCGSIITMLVVTSGFTMVTALSWLSGSTYARDWGNVVQLLPWLVILFPLAWLCSRWLDVMALGEDLPRSLGMSLERARLAVLAIAVGLAASAVAICGTIGFVGLIGPHATRMLISGRHRWQIPYAAVLGAMLVIAADMLGRSVIPDREVPTGLVTALIGTPYFLWLLSHSKVSAR
jgi:iron complex transport system permease protein